MTPFSNMQKVKEKKLKHQNECHLQATHSNSTDRSLWVVRQNLKREKMFRYMDKDGNPFQGWYSTVQPSSFEKVCVCACRLWLQGRHGLLSCLSYVQRTSTIG